MPSQGDSSINAFEYAQLKNFLTAANTRFAIVGAVSAISEISSLISVRDRSWMLRLPILGMT